MPMRSFVLPSLVCRLGIKVAARKLNFYWQSHFEMDIQI